MYGREGRILNRLTAKTIVAGIMIPTSAHAALKPSVAVLWKKAVLMVEARKNAAMAHRIGVQSEIMLCTASAFLEVAMLTMLPSFNSKFLSLLTANGVPRCAHCSLQERHAPVIIGRT